MRFARVGVAVPLGIMAVLACGDNQGPPVQHLPFEGIRQFDENCVSIGGDTTDFIPRPRYPSDSTVAIPPQNYSLVAACPNPTQFSSTRIEFQIPQPDSVWLFVYDRTNSPPIDTLYAHNAPAGNHLIAWYNPGAEGIFRVEMRTRSGFRSHGDVQFIR